MKRQTALDRAIAAMERDRLILQLAIEKLKEQRPEQEPKRTTKPRRLVGSEDRAS